MLDFCGELLALGGKQQDGRQTSIIQNGFANYQVFMVLLDHVSSKQNWHNQPITDMIIKRPLQITLSVRPLQLASYSACHSRTQHFLATVVLKANCFICLDMIGRRTTTPQMAPGSRQLRTMLSLLIQAMIMNLFLYSI